MVRTYGLTHISLAVRDLGRARQLQTPGAHDVIVLEEQSDAIESGTAVEHFGFQLIDATDIDQAVDEAQRAGGTLLRDPDRNEIGLWYE